MTAPIQYREYQAYGIGELWRYFNSGASGNPLVLMPTGTGKSIVIAGFAYEAMQVFPGTRVCVVTHVKELVKQNYDKFCTIWRGAPAGICSAGLKRYETHYPITFGGIDTLINRVRDLGKIHILIIDETHLVSDKETTTYLRFINALKDVNPKLKIIGFTATGWRQKLGMLTNGPIFTDIAVDMTSIEWFNYFVTNGFLSRLIVPEQSVEMALDGIKTVNGEFKQSDVESAAFKITDAALVNSLRYFEDRRKWLCFASGVEHAEYVYNWYKKQGIRSGVVHSKMSAMQRDETIAALKEGALQVVSNYGVLTTGFDAPDIDAILMLRATQVSSLWVQMLGRGMRTAPGKANCLVLDHGRNARRLGPINDPVIPGKSKGRKGDAPVKICDACGCFNHISARECEACGEPFQFKVKYKERAGNDQVMVSDEIPKPEPTIERFEVRSVYYSKYNSKRSGMTTFKVSYVTVSGRVFAEYINIEAKGWARKHAAAWWEMHTNKPLPETVNEALNVVSELAVPKAIKVRLCEGELPKVLGHEYI